MTSVLYIACALLAALSAVTSGSDVVPKNSISSATLNRWSGITNGNSNANFQPNNYGNGYSNIQPSTVPAFNTQPITNGDGYSVNNNAPNYIPGRTTGSNYNYNPYQYSNFHNNANQDAIASPKLYVVSDYKAPPKPTLGFTASTMAAMLANSRYSGGGVGNQYWNGMPSTTMGRRSVRSGTLPCEFQPNSALSVLAASTTLTMNDALVVMASVDSVPNTIGQILTDAGTLGTLAAKTNLFLASVPMEKAKTPEQITEIASATMTMNMLVWSTPSIRSLDYATKTTEVLAAGTSFGPTELCVWLNDEIATQNAAAAATATTASAATAAVNP